MHSECASTAAYGYSARAAYGYSALAAYVYSAHHYTTVPVAGVVKCSWCCVMLMLLTLLLGCLVAWS